MTLIEAPESSSPIVTRAVAAGLCGEYCENYPFPGWQKTLLTLLGGFPQRVGRFAISRFESVSGLPPRLLNEFSMDYLVRTRINDYALLTRKYPIITAGPALGGATAYLSLALGGPFLPQAFVLTLKGGSPDGNVETYLHRSLKAALRIADANPGLMTIQHFDPVHDGWMTRFVNHLRVKLLTLPPAYASFIKERLEPGGAIVYLDSGASWQRYRLGPRSIFQVGGWGGIYPEEFLEGSDRLRDYARHSGLKITDWKLKDYPLEQGPESEWGSEPGLAEALESFCNAEGYRFVRLHLSHPNDFSRLAFAAALKLSEKEHREPAGVLVEMFSQFDSFACMQSGLLPLWLIFNTDDSLAFLKEMSTRFPKRKPVFFSPLATFSLPPDRTPFDEWAAALADFDWVNIGSRRSHYPADARALVNWADPLRKWVRENYRPLITRISAEELACLSKSLPLIG
jgi:hypothetical protein